MRQNQNATITIDVDWADLDLFGHVNNVAFFKYIQAARISYCEYIGLGSLNEDNKPGFMVASSQCQFKKPLHYPARIIIKAKASEVKNSSIQLHYIIESNNNLIAEAADVIVVFDHRKKSKIPVPEAMRRKIEEIENNN